MIGSLLTSDWRVSLCCVADGSGYLPVQHDTGCDCCYCHSITACHSNRQDWLVAEIVRRILRSSIWLVSPMYIDWWDVSLIKNCFRIKNADAYKVVCFFNDMILTIGIICVAIFCSIDIDRSNLFGGIFNFHLASPALHYACVYNISLCVSENMSVPQCCLQDALCLLYTEFLDSTTIEACNVYSQLQYEARPTLFLEFNGSNSAVDEQAAQVGTHPSGGTLVWGMDGFPLIW